MTEEQKKKITEQIEYLKVIQETTKALIKILERMMEQEDVQK